MRSEMKFRLLTTIRKQLQLGFFSCQCLRGRNVSERVIKSVARPPRIKKNMMKFLGGSGHSSFSPSLDLSPGIYARRIFPHLKLHTSIYYIEAAFARNYNLLSSNDSQASTITRIVYVLLCNYKLK